MLNSAFAHTGQPPAPHDLGVAWNLEPVLISGLLIAAWVYARGCTVVGAMRRRCFAGALVALGVALLSPLDALSTALASAHMVQHVLVVLVAAPLLAASAPSGALLRGSPLPVRQAVGRCRRRLRVVTRPLRALRHPGTVWVLHVVTLWFWHAAVPYGAALEHEPIHVVEHSTFLLTGVLFWRVILSPRRAIRVVPGSGVILVFAMGMQSVFLSLLLTFAPSPWYSAYATSTSPWQLTPLADQQLAGVIMWVPAGLVYLAVGLALVVTWVRDDEAWEGVTLAAARRGPR